MSSFAEICVIVLLLFFNGILAMTEIALVSARKARLHQWADEGDKAAKLALSMANAPNDYLSAIQVGITLVGIFAGAFAGATIAEEFAVHLARIPEMAPYAEAVSIAIVVTSITFFSLIFGELVPKRIALIAPERIAQIIAYPLQFLTVVCKPVVAILTASTNFVLRVTGIKESGEPSVTEAEIHLMVEQATQAGVFEEQEQEMVARVLELGDRKVTKYMTPRIQIDWIDVNDSREKILAEIRASIHDRLVVAVETLDEVVGTVEVKEILGLALDGKEFDVKELVKDPLYIPESTTVLDLVEKFRQSRQHLALVLDEYGGVHGLITPDDVLEAVVGDLPEAENALDEPQIKERKDGSWLVDAQLSIDEFKRHFGLDEIEGENETEFQTVAGFILFKLEHIPEESEHFEYDGLRIEVVDMDRHRIDKVLVSKVVKSDESEE
jgi:Hemolysins and related proteins containing CBS domains